MEKMKAYVMSLLLCGAVQASAQTLAECQQAAERNYPLIRQYDLVRQTAGISVESIQKGWLPQVSAVAQVTYQSDVPQLPDALTSVMRQGGYHIEGLRRDQYRVGVDVSQTVYDGGRMREQQQVARLRGDVEEAQTDVDLWTVRQRVNELFFSLLLVEDRLRMNDDLQVLLLSGERKLFSMLNHGTAAESDYNTVRAERLCAVQQHDGLESQRKTLCRMLSLLCGMEVSKPVRPAVPPTAAEADSRFARLVESQLRLAGAEEKVLDTRLRPQLQVFAQGFYGYPGFNMFHDMMSRQWTLNGLVGARLTWNIGALYTRRADRQRLDLQRERLGMQLDMFLLNSRMEQEQRRDEADRCRQLMVHDDEIIALRTSVRKAAESKLAHGIIDVNELVKEINSEDNAKTTRSLHEIEMLKHAYDLLYVLGK